MIVYFQLMIIVTKKLLVAYNLLRTIRSVMDKAQTSLKAAWKMH